MLKSTQIWRRLGCQPPTMRKEYEGVNTVASANREQGVCIPESRTSTVLYVQENSTGTTGLNRTVPHGLEDAPSERAEQDTIPGMVSPVTGTVTGTASRVCMCTVLLHSTVRRPQRPARESAWSANIAEFLQPSSQARKSLRDQLPLRSRVRDQIRDRIGQTHVGNGPPEFCLSHLP